METFAIKKSSNPMALPNLPEELIFGLLLKLPVKSLLRFRCLSKSWCSLLSSSEFIKTHLKISSEDKTFVDHRVLLPLQGSPSTLYTFSLHEGGYENSTVNPAILDVPVQTLNGTVTLVGSINGLVCMYLDYYGKIILWNPSIRKFKELPISASQFISLGFGYDNSTDDYKIVGFCTRYIIQTEVKVYSLKTNSLYKIQDYSDGNIYAYCLGKFVSGSLHWMALSYKNSWCTYYIASFDIVANTFGTISMPDFDEYLQFRWSLEVLGGCLAVFYSNLATEMHVYIMKDYAEKKWTKLICIPYMNELRSFTETSVSSVFLFENGGILLSFGSNLVLCKDGEVFVKNRGACDEGYALVKSSCVTYFESLVSPDINEDIAFTTDERRERCLDPKLCPQIEFE